MSEQPRRRFHLRSSKSDRFRERLAAELNAAQIAAATAPDGPNLILAGPGSGKTRVITYRVAYLIAKGVPASSILLVTFTRRAAREMLGRLTTLIGPDSGQVWAGTFHHLGNRLLRRWAPLFDLPSSFTILDSEDQRDLIKLAMEDAGMGGKTRDAYTPRAAELQHLISFSFNLGTTLEAHLKENRPDLDRWMAPILEVAARYEERKRKRHCLDFDDLLRYWGRLLEEYPDVLAKQARMFPHVLVDELQDTNKIQVELVERIAKAGAGNLTAVGDEAQSIYKFRGAHYDNILKFPERNPGTLIHRLEVNYRSTPEIVALTNASLACQTTGFGKTLVSARGPGAMPVVVPLADADEEATFVCDRVIEAREAEIGLGELAVLYRNSFDSLILQAELSARGIPYEVRGGLRFFEKAHIKDVLAHLRILVNPRDELAWNRLLQLLPGIGPAKSAAIRTEVIGDREPMARIESAEVMAIVPPRSKGHFAAFVGDLRAIRGVDPESRPAEGVLAVLRSGYQAALRTKYAEEGMSPDDRIAEIEQLAALATRYQRLDTFLSDLVVAGDVEGTDGEDPETPTERLVLSTIHQAKGLEWRTVFLIRLVQGTFPHQRGLQELGGEDEERRLFYVAVSRARDELYLTYPLTQNLPGRSYEVTRQSQFLEELPNTLYELAEVVSESDLDWTEGVHHRRKADEPSEPEGLD